MKLYAFAALLALPLLGLGAGSASADYYCCGKNKHKPEIFHTHVVKDSAVFGCDAYHCETKVKVYSGTKVEVYCRNGWCEIKNLPVANMWVLESCLKPIYSKHHGKHGYPYGKADDYEDDIGDDYKPNYRKY